MAAKLVNKAKTQSLINDYFETFAGQQLKGKHNLSDYGQWQIRGEDPNCDLGGPHGNPDLGIYCGTLQEVLEVAVNLPQFWTWSGGGEITFVTVRDAKTVAEMVSKSAELKCPICDEYMTENPRGTYRCPSAPDGH
jgi:hypothetical protein